LTAHRGGGRAGGVNDADVDGLKRCAHW
jgi:hypothetical protein